MNHLFVFIGTTGVGKTFYSQYVINKYGLRHIQSITTRPPRSDKNHEYIHLTKEQFSELIKKGEMLEYTTFHGNYYGKRKSDIAHGLARDNCVITMTPDVVSIVKEKVPESIVILLTLEEPVLENTIKRLGERNFPDNVLAERIETVKSDLDFITKEKSSGVIDHEVVTIEGDKQATFLEIDKIVEKYL